MAKKYYKSEDVLLACLSVLGMRRSDIHPTQHSDEAKRGRVLYYVACRKWCGQPLNTIGNALGVKGMVFHSKTYMELWEKFGDVNTLEAVGKILSGGEVNRWVPLTYNDPGLVKKAVRSITDDKKILSYCLRNISKLSYPEIAKALHQKNHQYAYHACAELEKWPEKIRVDWLIRVSGAAGVLSAEHKIDITDDSDVPIKIKPVKPGRVTRKDYANTKA